MKCCYCRQNHPITNCPHDKGLISLLDNPIQPIFEQFTLRVIKRIASLYGVKTSLSKARGTTKRTPKRMVKPAAKRKS